MMFGLLCGSWLASAFTAMTLHALSEKQSRREVVDQACCQLGLPLDFSSAMLQARFRAISRFVHPDRCNGVRASSTLFQKMQAAHTVLSEESRRREAHTMHCA